MAYDYLQEAESLSSVDVLHWVNNNFNLQTKLNNCRDAYLASSNDFIANVEKLSAEQLEAIVEEFFKNDKFGDIQKAYVVGLYRGMQYAEAKRSLAEYKAAQAGVAAK